MIFTYIVLSHIAQKKIKLKCGFFMLYVATVLLPIIGAVASFVFLLWLIIAAIKKKPKKTPLIGLGVSVLLTVVGYILYGTLLGM